MASNVHVQGLNWLIVGLIGASMTLAVYFSRFSTAQMEVVGIAAIFLTLMGVVMSVTTLYESRKEDTS